MEEEAEAMANPAPCSCQNMSRFSMSVAVLPITAGTHVPLPVASCELLLLLPVLPLLLLLLWLPSCRHLSRHDTPLPAAPSAVSVVQSKTCHFLRAAAVYFKIGRALCRLVLASLTLGLLSASRAVVVVVAGVAVVPAVSFGWPKSFHSTGHPPVLPFGLSTCRYFLAILIFKKQKLKTFVADFFCNFRRAGGCGE